MGWAEGFEVGQFLDFFWYLFGYGSG